MNRERRTNHVPLHIAVHIMRGTIEGRTSRSIPAVHAWTNGDKQRINSVMDEVRAINKYLRQKDDDRALGRAVLQVRQAIDRGSPEQIGRAYRELAVLADPKPVLSL